ncbi:MAG: chemotaxis protein CheD [Actinobacteria bacterium]|nr:MAG: chemotaxis protein CheD [Actinomycetota bacterium]
MDDPLPVLHVGVAEIRVVDSRHKLVSSALGSCLAVALYEPVKKVGALAHIMLPSRIRLNGTQPEGKFADNAIPTMLEEMCRAGALRTRITAKIVGGAQMFADDSMASIGERNVFAVKALLKKTGIRVSGEDTGGSHARTIEFDTGTGQVLSRSVRFGIKEL